MIKILMIVPSLAEKGPVIVAENIGKYIADKNINIKYLSLRNNDEKPKHKWISNNLEFAELGMGKIPSFYNFKELKKIIAEYSPNVIHVHSFYPTVLVAFLRGKYKKIVTLHNNPKEDYVYGYGKILGTILYKVQGFTLKKYDAVVSISKYAQNAHEEWIEKCLLKEVIVNGIEKLKVEAVEVNTFTLISTSLLIKRKNIITVLKAVKLATDNGIKIKYIIIGDGEERELLEKFVQNNNLSETVIFLGRQPRNILFEYLAKSSCLILPSFSEGSVPLSVIECFMFGKPVISSKIEPLENMLIDGKHGYLCDVTDAHDYYQAIIKMQDKKKREEMSKNVVAYYEEKFRVEDMSKKYADLYKKVCGDTNE